MNPSKHAQVPSDAHAPFPAQSVAASHGEAHVAPTNPPSQTHRPSAAFHAPFEPQCVAGSAGSGVSQRSPLNPGVHSHSPVMPLHVPLLTHPQPLHPGPVNFPLHAHFMAPDASSYTHAPFVGGHVPDAHVMATHIPFGPVGAYPGSHSHVASERHVPRPPQIFARGESRGASIAGGPAPGQCASQFAPVHPSRHAHVAPSSPNRPVHVCIVEPSASRSARGMPHSHDPDASRSWHASPTYPSLQWHRPLAASHDPRFSHGPATPGHRTSHAAPPHPRWHAHRPVS